MRGRGRRLGATAAAALTALATTVAGAAGTAGTARAATPTGFGVLAVVAGHGPAEALAVDPGRHLLYVTEGSRRRLALVDTRTDRTTGQIALRGVPVSVAVDVRTHRAYVALRDGRLQVLVRVRTRHRTRYRTLALVKIGAAATAVAVDAVGHRAYVTASTKSSAPASATSGIRGVLAVVDTRRERLVREVAVGSAPAAVALDPAVHIAYVLDRGSSTLSAVDTTRAVVSTTLATGSGAAGLAVDTVDHGAWITSSTTGTVEIVSGSDPGAIRLMRLGGTPAGLAIDNVHHLAFIANRDGQVQIFGSGAAAVTWTVQLPTSPDAVAVDPAAHRVYVSNGATGAVTVIRFRS